MSQLLIVGVDPGTTLAYAALDINGNVVKIGSSKHLEFGELVKAVAGEGLVIAIGTDKKKCPFIIQKLSAQTGARIISPKSDLLAKEKNELTREFMFSNGHEADALAAARFAYKTLYPLLNKIDAVLKKRKKELLGNEVKRIVITRGISIVSALEELEPQIEEEAEEKLVDEEKIFTQEDYLRLRKRHNALIKENSLMKSQNSALMQQLNDLRKGKLALDKTISRLIHKQRVKDTNDFREKRLLAMHSELSKKGAIAIELQEEIKKLNLLISRIGTGTLLKRLSNLGWEELCSKNKLLNIREGDSLIVEDPNILSPKTADFLRDRIDIIVTDKKANKKTIEEINAVFIDSCKVRIEKEGNFALANKEDIERERSKATMLAEIIEDYKNRRSC